MPIRVALFYNRQLPGVLQEMWGGRKKDRPKDARRDKRSVGQARNLMGKLGAVEVVPQGELAKMRAARIKKQ